MTDAMADLQQHFGYYSYISKIESKQNSSSFCRAD